MSATIGLIDWQLVRAIYAVQYNRDVDVTAFAQDLEIDVDEASELIAEASARLGVSACFCCDVTRH